MLGLIDERTPQEVVTASDVRSRPPVVCLIGSTKFKQAFIEANFLWTRRGHIVLSVGWFSHADGHVYQPTEEEKRRLDELHLRKIDWADFCYCLNVEEPWCTNCRTFCDCNAKDDWNRRSRCCDQPIIRRGYVGESTLREIDYARRSGKRVEFLNDFFDPR